MKTRLISIAIVLIISLTNATAQSTGKTSFGILGGVNFQNLNGKNIMSDKLENKLTPGFHFGVNVQIPIVPEFYFQPGALFSTKGAKNTESAVTTTTRISYIEIPMNFLYKSALGNGFIFLGIGPYVGFALMGSVKNTGDTESLKRDIEFRNVVEIGDPITVPYYKAFDAGGNILFGYEMAVGLFAQMNAQLGMMKINPEDKRIPEDKSIVKNTGFGISVGYRF
jgi:hypothetical protein